MLRLQLEVLACDHPEDAAGDRIQIRIERGGRTEVVEAPESASMRAGSRWNVGHGVDVASDVTASVFQRDRNHSLGRIQVARAAPATVGDSPWAQLDWHGAHYTLRYRIVEARDAGADAPMCDPDELACIDFEMSNEDDAPLPSTREHGQALDLAIPDPDEIRGWPRRSIALKEVRQQRNVTVMYLYFPERSRRERLVEFTRARFVEYLAHVGRSPALGDASTWGPKLTLELSVCSLRNADDGSRRLVFDASDPNTRWSFDIFNLDASQPRWRAMVERTLARLPIEFLRMLHMKSVVCDFRIGTDRLGPDAAVGSGGANWPYLYARTDRSQTAGLGVSFSALNRRWSSGGLPASEASIDAGVDRGRSAVGTLFHEFGHLYHHTPRRREDFASDEELRRERGFLAAVNRRAAALGPPATEAAEGEPAPASEPDSSQTLWDRYRVATGYAAGGGRSQGPGEGFAEAFRTRMQGEDPRALAGEVNEALDACGLPTLASVQEAAAAIRRHEAGG